MTWGRRVAVPLGHARFLIAACPALTSVLQPVSVKDAGALAGSKTLAEVLEKHGIKHELTVTGGGHTWINWRHYLNELAPRLFR